MPVIDLNPAPDAIYHAGTALDAFRFGGDLLWQRPAGSMSGSSLSLNLTGISDWNTQQPFMNIMKHGRGFQAGSMNHAALRAAGHLDANGYPTSIPSGASDVWTVWDWGSYVPGRPDISGRYVLKYDGAGTIHVNAGVVSQTAGRIVFDVTGGTLLISVRAITAGNHPRNWRICKLAHEAALDAGQMFNPAWLARISGCRTLRFMDWGLTNHSSGYVNGTHTHASWFGNWAERSRLTDIDYEARGAPIEVIVHLANTLNINPWVNIPHVADDTYIRNYAAYVCANLAPNLQVRVEWSNEHWGFHFPAAHWCSRQAQAAWGSSAWYEWAAKRATQAAVIWNEEWAKVSGAKPRLINVLGAQFGWDWGVTQMLLSPTWRANEPGSFVDPRTIFHEVAVATYFGGSVVSTASSRNALVAQINADPATARTWLRNQLMTQSFPSSIPSMAGAYTAMKGALQTVFNQTGRKIRLSAYEGGTHVQQLFAVEVPPADLAVLTPFLMDFSYSQEMGDLYTAWANLWQAHGEGPHMEFGDVSRPSQWGSWAARRFPSDENPRAAVVDSLALRTPWWTE